MVIISWLPLARSLSGDWGGVHCWLPVAWSLPGVWGLVARSLPVAQSLPGVWGVTSGHVVTSGVWGLVEGSLPVARSLPGDWGVTFGGVTWAKTMVVTSISHMGEMRDSDWSRPNFLRSDWLPTIWAMYTTFAPCGPRSPLSPPLPGTPVCPGSPETPYQHVKTNITYTKNYVYAGVIWYFAHKIYFLFVCFMHLAFPFLS